MKDKKDKLLNDIKTACIGLSKWYYTKDLTRKEFALYIMNNYKDISSFLFKYLDNLPEDVDTFVNQEWNKLTLNYRRLLLNSSPD